MWQMSRFREALEDACKAVEIVLLRKYYDPAGQAQDEPRLRGMGKWRFIPFRGIVGFSVPMFLFLALSDLSENIQTAHAFHHPMVRYLLGHWLAGFCMTASVGFVVGLLAWRRIVSDVWPGAQPDPESCTITLGL